MQNWRGCYWAMKGPMPVGIWRSSAHHAHQGMQDIAANLPAGQVSLIEDASVGVRAALLRRAICASAPTG